MVSPNEDRPPNDWSLPPVPQRRVPVGAGAPSAPGTVTPAAPEVEAEMAARKAHVRRWLGLVVIAFAQLLIVIDGTIVNVALPAMAEDLDLAAADRQWVITAYTLAFGGLLLLGGRVADYLGLRRTMVIGLIGFAISSALGGAATNFELLLTARAAQGVFGALLAPAALALLATTFHDPVERAKAFAIYGVVAGGGSAIGLIAGGILTEYASWRWTMFINVPFAIIAVIGAYLLLDEVRGDHPGRLDILGAVLATSGLLSVVYSFSEAERQGWTKPGTLALLGVGLSLLIMFVVSQRIVQNPLLPLRVLADRTRGGANVAITLAALSMIGAFFFLTFYLQEVLAFSPVKTGVAFLPVTGGIIVASAVISNIMPKVPPRLLMGGGLIGSSLALVLISQLTADSTYLADLLFPLVLLGLTLGAVFVPAFNAATYGIDPRDAGIAGAAVNTAQQVGASLGVALLSSIAAHRASGFLDGKDVNSDTLIDAQVAGYSRASLVAGLILLVAAAITIALINVRRLNAHGGLGEIPPAAVPLPVPPEAVTTAIEFGVEVQPTYEAALLTQATSGVSAAFPVQTSAKNTIPPVFMEAGEMTSPQPGAGTNGHASSYPTAPTGEVAPTWIAAGAPGANPMIGPRDGGGSPALRVLVRRTDGSAVVGAIVTLLDNAGRQIAHADSDGRGCAEFDPEGGEFLLVVRHEGYLPQARTVLLSGAVLASTVEIEVLVTGASRLAGTVTTSARRAVEGALVTLTGSDGAVAASTRTDAGGWYELVDLTIEAGTLAVFAPSARPVAVPIRVPAGSRIRQDIEVHGSAAVSGVAQTPEGWLIADARVSLLGPGGFELAVTRTDADGRYSFTGIEEGHYTVVAVGYPPASTDIVVGGETTAPPITLGHTDDLAKPRAGSTTV